MIFLYVNFVCGLTFDGGTVNKLANESCIYRPKCVQLVGVAVTSEGQSAILPRIPLH